MTKIVFLILSHINPDQVIRLVKTLSAGSPHSKIIIHHDFSKTVFPAATVQTIENAHVIPDYIPVRWSDFSLVNATCHAIERITETMAFDWLVLISGQDYPIQPIKDIEKFLENSQYDGYINGVALEDGIPCGPVECSIVGGNRKKCIDCMSRYYYQYYDTFSNHWPAILRKNLQKIAKHINRPDSFIQIRTIPRQPEVRTVFGIKAFSPLFNENFKCYKGSTWFALNYRCIEYMRKFMQENERVIKYYRRTIFADESIFQTILLNNPNLKIANDNKRFISWKDYNAPSPEVLRVNDFHRIIKSGQHFARKFDSNVDSEILDLIDQHIMIKG
jgi:hypothetical protein